MTGFGRGLDENKQYRVCAEVKSVNHRYCEVSIKLPKKLGCLEQDIRTLLKEYAERGKIDIFITYEDYEEKTVSVKYNQRTAGEYIRYTAQMAEEFGIPNDMTVSVLSRMPDVFLLEERQADEKELWPYLEPVLREAFSAFSRTREEEGERLKADLEGKLQGMLGAIDAIDKRSPQLLIEYKDKIFEKARELLGSSSKVDESVLAAEIVIFADKVCVDEETVRLRSHIAAMQENLNKGGAVGRKLDFIAQEMNREANTILSKANDITVSDIAIELKTEIEKIREQIQNIE